MSRGPGTWQRVILDRVSSGGWHYLRDLLPERYTKTQYKALHRAMTALERKGDIAVYRYQSGRKRTLVGPLGIFPPAARPYQH
jgi:hypothetical protein